MHPGRQLNRSSIYLVYIVFVKMLCAPLQALMGCDVALGIPIGVQGNVQQGHTSMPLMMSSMQVPATISMVRTSSQLAFNDD
jgi:hypothetical protein